MGRSIPYKETALIVGKKLLEGILPRYGLPLTIGSDNGPAFSAEAIQRVAAHLGINRKLHCEYNPQSSGQVERMNGTLKETLTKLALETGGDWVILLPLRPVLGSEHTLPVRIDPF